MYKPIFISGYSMKKTIQSILIGLVAFGAIAANAANNLDQVSVTIKSNLKNNLPDLVVDRIIPTQISGIYEVDSGRKVFYVDSTGNYAFIGNLLDLKNKTSLTEQRTDDLNKIDWQKLPTDIAITRIIGNGQNRIAIFTDPDCPFCKRLEQETISKLTNVKIYYYFFPLPIHANAADDSRKILCSENPESAMISFMAKSQSLPTKNIKCNNAAKLSKMQEIGNDLVQVNGTPTIILPNGKIISGLVPADYLSRLIDENQPESANTTK